MLSDDMKEALRRPMSLSELTTAVMGMKRGTSPGPYGVVLEFFQELWPLICEDYFLMIT
jgi:hypothetical protein